MKEREDQNTWLLEHKRESAFPSQLDRSQREVFGLSSHYASSDTSVLLSLRFEVNFASGTAASFSLSPFTQVSSTSFPPSPLFSSFFFSRLLLFPLLLDAVPDALPPHSPPHTDRPSSAQILCQWQNYKCNFRPVSGEQTLANNTLTRRCTAIQQDEQVSTLFRSLQGGAAVFSNDKSAPGICLLYEALLPLLL